MMTQQFSTAIDKETELGLEGILVIAAGQKCIQGTASSGQASVKAWHM